MMDRVSLEQLRVLVAVVDEGSFSAAARKLRRVQSAVSHAVAGLEELLGVQLFDRSTRVPTLTEQGRVVVAAARRVCDETDGLKRLAQGLSSGLEGSVSIVVDPVFPMPALVRLCKEFLLRFPTVQLRLQSESLTTAASLVRDGSCVLGVVGPAAETPGLERRHLGRVRLVTVVGASHPLASHRGRLATSKLADHVQIVLSERGSEGLRRPDFGVLSPLTWRVAELGIKHALLLGGLGWGNKPEHLVRKELASKQLVRLRPEAWGEEEFQLSVSVVHRPDIALGPAGRWLQQRMGELCAESSHEEPPTKTSVRSKVRKRPVAR